ncbi:armadillo-type protein [Haematococcus lacustris]
MWTISLQNEVTNALVRKSEAAMCIWSHALGGELQREDIFKTQCIGFLVSMLERGQVEEKHAACGALYALAQSDKHLPEVVSPRVIQGAAALLGGDHDRSRLPAAQFLAFLAKRLEYSARVAEAALPALLAACSSGAVPGWSGSRFTALQCVTALRCLVENVQGEQTALKVLRRKALVEMGAVPTLVELVAYQPRMPDPSQVPASLPPSGRRPASLRRSKSGKKKGSKGKAGDERPAAGRKDHTATQAAACLRFLALCPQFTQHLLESGSLAKLVAALRNASSEQAAFIAGILWEITADANVAQLVLEAEGVSALLHVISTNLGQSKGKRKARPKKAKSTPASASTPAKESKPDKPEAAALPFYPEIAVCNAAGALHHLTFLDQAKQQVGQLGAQILALCLKSAQKARSPQTFENATGALWNCGLDAVASARLVEAGVPGYLAKPVPAHWVVAGEQRSPSPLQALPGHDPGPSPFLTQQHH